MSGRRIGHAGVRVRLSAGAGVSRSVHERAISPEFA
jgi:hypothetical protein